MSDVAVQDAVFFDRYLAGLASAADIDDCVEAWHEAPDSETRSLAAFLGMSDDEYAVYLMDPNSLAILRDRRLNGGSLPDAVANYVRRMRGRSNGTSKEALSAWLRHRA